VEGAATVTPADPDDVRTLAHRYLDPEAAEAYVLREAGGPRPIQVAMRPERWWTVDYSKAARARPAVPGSAPRFPVPGSSGSRPLCDARSIVRPGTRRAALSASIVRSRAILPLDEPAERTSDADR
jgi:hypothetical protein